MALVRGGDRRERSAPVRDLDDRGARFEQRLAAAALGDDRRRSRARRLLRVVVPVGALPAEADEEIARLDQPGIVAHGAHARGERRPAEEARRGREPLPPIAP